MKLKYLLFGLLTVIAKSIVSQSFLKFETEGSMDYVKYIVENENKIISYVNKMDYSKRPFYGHNESILLIMDKKLIISKQISYKDRYDKNLFIHAVYKNFKSEFIVVSATHEIDSQSDVYLELFSEKMELIQYKHYTFNDRILGIKSVTEYSENELLINGGIPFNSFIWKINRSLDSLQCQLFTNNESYNPLIYRSFKLSNGNNLILHRHFLESKPIFWQMSSIIDDDFKTIYNNCQIETNNFIGLSKPSFKSSMNSGLDGYLINDSIVFLLGEAYVKNNLKDTFDSQTMGMYYNFRACREVSHFRIGVQGYFDYSGYPAFVKKDDIIYTVNTINQFPANDRSYLILYKLKTDGTILKSVIFDNGDNPYASGIFELNDGRLAMTGLTRWGYQESRLNQGYGFILTTDTALNLPDLSSTRKIKSTPIQIYPNPATSNITLSGLPLAIWHWEISATNGQIMNSGTLLVNETDIDLSRFALPSGMYLLRLQSQNEVQVLKLLKQ